jgi:hypothetical protein
LLVLRLNAEELYHEKGETEVLRPTPVTWTLVVFGALLIFLPMLYAQLLMALRPNSQQAKHIIIGKGEDWRNETHFRMSFGAAWADLLIWFPVLIAGSAGVLLGKAWGYALWTASGAISVYISIILWFSEREYVYPAQGPLLYYTVYWGFFVYWGIAAVGYALLRLAGVGF